MMTTTRALQLFQVLRQGAVILTSIALAKSQLSVAEIGVYETLLYIGTVLTFFWVNGLLQAMTPLFERQTTVGKKQFIFITFMLFNGISILLFLIMFGYRGLLMPLLQVKPDLPFYEIFCFYLLFNLPSFVVEYYYLLHKKAWHIAIWGLLVFSLHVLAVAIPVYAGFGLQGSMYALLLLSAGKWCWTAWLVKQYGKPKWDKKISKTYLDFAWPLTLNVLVGNLVVMFDAWLVGHYYADESIFAIFRYGSRELPLAQALATALGVALIPVLTKDLKQGLAELKSMSLRLMHFLFPLTIVLLFVSKPLFPLVFSPAFAESAVLFNIYLCITATRVLLPNSIMLSLHRPKIILQAGMVELMAKVMLGFLFIQWWGLIGVAWSAVLAFWVEKLILIWNLQAKQQIRIERWLPWRWYLFYVSALALSVWITSW
jgi:O-antigen/teichoic acid export membrane protein